MKTWIKGGLIGLGIWFLIVLAVFFISISSLISGGTMERIIHTLTPGCSSENFGEILCPLFIYPIIYFFIGTIIGMVIQKIRYEKKIKISWKTVMVVVIFILIILILFLFQLMTSPLTRGPAFSENECKETCLERGFDEGVCTNNNLDKYSFFIHVGDCEENNDRISSCVCTDESFVKKEIVNSTKISEDCISEGDVGFDKNCCEGLKEIYACESVVTIRDQCYYVPLYGGIGGCSGSACINCGDGICGSRENLCNCREDCEGKVVSDFENVSEFCESINNYEEICSEGDNSESEYCKLCS